MKKNMIVGMALAMGLFGAFTVSAAEACEKCVDKQVMQKFTNETAGLSAALKAKDLQLRELYGYDRIDTQKLNILEAEIKELKEKMNRPLINSAYRPAAGVNSMLAPEPGGSPALGRRA